MKIAITGGSGLLGRQCAQDLLVHHQVSCFQRNASEIGDIKAYALDVNEVSETQKLLRGFDLVIHMAAKVSFHKKDEIAMYKTNVQGTQNVVNACIANGIPKFILISSTAALDSAKNPMEITEKNLWDRASEKTSYAITKYLAELEAWRGQEEGLQVATVCPGVIIGDGSDSQSSNQLYDVVKKKWSVYPSGRNGFINAIEVSKIIGLIIEKEAYGKRYLAVTHNISYKELLQLLADKLKLKAPQYPLKGALLYVAIGMAKTLEFFGLKSPLPSQGLRNTNKNIKYLPQNIYTELEYQNGPLI